MPFIVNRRPSQVIPLSSLYDGKLLSPLERKNCRRFALSPFRRYHVADDGRMRISSLLDGLSDTYQTARQTLKAAPLKPTNNASLSPNSYIFSYHV
jgi:hypothetical protein